MVCDVRWKFVDLSLNKNTWFRLLLVFLFLTFHKVVWQHIWGEVGSSLIILTPVSYWMCRWNNYENRSIFSKDMVKSIVSLFFWLTLYIRFCVLLIFCLCILFFLQSLWFKRLNYFHVHSNFKPNVSWIKNNRPQQNFNYFQLMLHKYCQTVW